MTGAYKPLADAERVERAKELALKWAASPLTRQMAGELIEALDLPPSPRVARMLQRSLADYEDIARSQSKQRRLRRLQEHNFDHDQMMDLLNRGGAA